MTTIYIVMPNSVTNKPLMTDLFLVLNIGKGVIGRNILGNLHTIGPDTRPRISGASRPRLRLLDAHPGRRGFVTTSAVPLLDAT